MVLEKVCMACACILVLSASCSHGSPFSGTYARDCYDENSGVLSYAYAGEKLIEVRPVNGSHLKYRKISDGCLMTTPLCQQIYVGVTNEAPVEAEIIFHLSSEALCMRPRRAVSGEAVLGQVGMPLLHGVNGLYDVLRDLMIDWSGHDWEWDGREIAREGDGLCARLRVRLSRVPWIINLRPRYYREHLGFGWHDPSAFRPRQEPVAGWCSWRAYVRNVNLVSITNAAAVLSRDLRDYGLEYLQIDDGYEPEGFGITKERNLRDCWLGATEKFPGGICQAAGLIKGYGLRPGIWMSTDLRKYEPSIGESNLVLRGSDGKVLKAPWIRNGLSGSKECLETTIAPVLREFVGAGFEYVKVDTLRHNYYDAFGTAVEQGIMDTEEARGRFRNFFAVIREAIGKDCFFLPCWGVFSEGVGYADAMRLAIDANPYWEMMLEQQYDMARYWQLQRILFQLDPDHVCCRAPVSWTRSVLSTVSLAGGLMMLSDTVDCYKDARLDVVRQCLPPLMTYPAETGPLELGAPAYANMFLTFRSIGWEDNCGRFEGKGEMAPFGTLWAIHCSGPAGYSCIVQRNGLWNLPAGNVGLEKLGLNPEWQYLAFDYWSRDYWQGKFMGMVSGELELPLLGVGQCQTIVLRPYLKRPQFLGATRHVSGGYRELISESWDEEGKRLELLFSAQPGPYLVYVHVPEGFRKKTADWLDFSGVKIKDTKANDDRIIRLLVSPGEGETARITFCFENE